MGLIKVPTPNNEVTRPIVVGYQTIVQTTEYELLNITGKGKLLHATVGGGATGNENAYIRIEIDGATVFNTVNRDISVISGIVGIPFVKVVTATTVSALHKTGSNTTGIRNFDIGRQSTYPNPIQTNDKIHLTNGITFKDSLKIYIKSASAGVGIQGFAIAELG